MDIVVRGRQVELSERFREHASERIGKLERFDSKIQRVDVEVSKEQNPRLAERALRVELTVRSRGPVVRAEAASDDKFVALDIAYDRLEARLRKAADRRHDHHRRGDAVPSDAWLDSAPPIAESAHSDEDDATAEELPDDGPMVVREKTHTAVPMTLDQALEAMELVGHDFYLFQDSASGTASVVYRRRGYHYGVLHLVPNEGSSFDGVSKDGAA